MKRRQIPLAMLLLLLFFLASCSKTQQLPQLTPIPLASPTRTQAPALVATDFAWQATPSPQPSPTAWVYASLTPTPDPLAPKPKHHDPLTGLSSQTLLQSDQRPILVKLANWPEALRPQTGLNEADIVFEYFIGAQTNHLAALYYGNLPDKIVPLAPARAVDTRLAVHYDADLAYQSARPNIQDSIRNSLPDRHFMANTLPCPAICIEPLAKGGNIAVDIPALREYISSLNREDARLSLGGMVFNAKAGAGDGVAAGFTYMYADFSVMDWHYDLDSGRYLLWQDHRYAPGKYRLVQSFDRDSKEPISFDNILILYTHYISYGEDGYDIDMRQSDPDQQALLIRDGKIFYGTWLVAADGRPIQFKDKNGQDLPLKPGRTWITFASINTVSKQVSPGFWELTFSFN